MKWQSGVAEKHVASQLPYPQRSRQTIQLHSRSSYGVHHKDNVDLKSQCVRESNIPVSRQRVTAIAHNEHRNPIDRQPPNFRYVMSSGIRKVEANDN